jgi:hypothetical protein
MRSLWQNFLHKTIGVLQSVLRGLDGIVPWATAGLVLNVAAIELHHLIMIIEYKKSLKPDRNALMLLLRPCEVLSSIAHPPILEVAHNALRVLLQHRHVLVGRFT